MKNKSLNWKKCAKYLWYKNNMLWEKLFENALKETEYEIKAERLKKYEKYFGNKNPESATELTTIMKEPNLFPKYLYKNKIPYKRTITHIPENNIWEIGYFNKQDNSDYYMYKWDGSYNHADAILKALFDSGLKKEE